MMVDIEDLSAPDVDSIILQIGAVIFSESSHEDYWRSVSFRLSARDQLLRSVDLETMMFWLGQPSFSTLLSGEIELDTALQGLADFYKVAQRLNDDALVWAWGSDYDIPKLANAFRSKEIEVPWRLDRVRCARTVCKMAGVKRGENEAPHDAFADCIVQARAVVAASEKIAAGTAALRRAI